jgi:hypothetical protein
MTRAEHLAWCKERALEYVDAGDLPNAVASMTSDLGKHPETQRDRRHYEFLLGVGMIDAMMGDAPAVRRWIEGSN